LFFMNDNFNKSFDTKPKLFIIVHEYE